MTIAIDMREACAERKTGKGQWTYAFVSELVERTNHSYVLYTDAALPEAWSKLSHLEHVSVRVIAAKGLRWHWKVAQDVRRNANIDVYVSPVSYIVPVLLRDRIKTIPIVHDLIAFRNEPHDVKARIIEKITLRRALTHAHAVCTVSATTKQDLLHRFAFLQHKTVLPIFAAPVLVVDPFNREQAHNTIVCIGTLCPRKNQAALIRAFSSLSPEDRQDYSLTLIGGRGWKDAEIVELASKTEHVEWKKYVSNAELLNHLAHAGVLAMPSVYEGFGLPIVEAMHAGVPVLTSNIGSMKEVAGDAALFVDPTNQQSIAEGLRTIISNKTLQSELSVKGINRAKQFTWQHTVDTFLSLLSA